MGIILKDKIENKINQLKKELIQIAETTGLNSHDTLCCSQKLDRINTIYQKLYKKEKRSMLLNNNKVVKREKCRPAVSMGGAMT